MEGISDLKIIGFDEARPPRIRKEPYINLFFKLNHKAPRDWCESFNASVAKGKYPIKVNLADRQIIETWVRKPEEIEAVLETLKKAVRQCSADYLARMEAEAAKAADVSGGGQQQGEQERLNQLISRLKFDD